MTKDEKDKATFRAISILLDSLPGESRQKIMRKIALQSGVVIAPPKPKKAK